MSKGVKAFVAGILITVVGGLILWYLTLPGSIINPVENPRPETPHASIKIKDIIISNPEPGDPAWAHFTVINHSGTIGENVEVKWYSGTDVGKELRQDPSAAGSTCTVTKFYLHPNESHPVKMQSLKYSEAGRFLSKISVEIQVPNSFIIADEHTKEVVVRPLEGP